MKFKDFGNPTRAEIDRLYKILTRYKKQGQFRAFWSAFTDSVNLMVSKEVVIESMWSPAVALVKAAGVNILYAAPKEGFRGWCSAEGISSKVTDPAKLQACYDYINWNYNGYLGAMIMRQGYYIANGQKLLPWINRPPGKKAGFTPAEYDYWWGGKPARATCPASPARSATSRRASDARAARSRSASASTLLELVSARERLPRQDRERLPDRLAGRMEDQGVANRGGGSRRPLDTNRVRARSHRVDEGLPRRNGRRRRRQPPRRPRRVRRPARAVRLREDDDAADDRRARVPDRRATSSSTAQSLIDLPPHKRPTTTVFQHFALFPHRTMLQNVEFGLKMHGIGKEERRQAAFEALEMVGLSRSPTGSRAPSRAGSSSASPSRACS